MRLPALLLSIALLTPPAAHAADGPRINALRILGSHNSYRPELDPAALAHQRQVMGEHSAGVEYGHPPIQSQLDLGLRELEFDPYADSAGGLYAPPYANDPARLAIMQRPGAKVLHAPVVDARTHCLTLADCFGQVAAWSRKSRSTLRASPIRRCSARPTWPGSTPTPSPPSAATTC
jgi:hypothetical protein